MPLFRPNISHIVDLYNNPLYGLTCIYKETQENERLYKICEDQEDVIQLQLEAIDSQKAYISQLQYNYNSLYYGQGSSYYIPNKKENTNPIH